MSLIASIDLGTTSVRAALYEADGTIAGTARHALRIGYEAGGRVEQDPTEFATAPVRLLAEALSAAGRHFGDVAAIGIVNQRGSALAWDSATGRPLTPVIGWQDRRTHERVAELRSWGLPATTMATCTKFEWLLHHDRAVQDAARGGTLRLGTPDVWLTWVLTGGDAFVTDPSNAAVTGLYDPAAGQWFELALDLFEVPVEALPAVVASSAVVGTTTEATVGAPVPVAGRAGDQQGACFGQGLDAPGAAKLTLGTSAMLDVHTGDAPVDPPPPGAYALPLWRLHGDGGSPVDAYCVEGSVVTAGAAVEWLVRMGLLGAVEDFDGAVSRGGAEALLVPTLAGIGTPDLLDDVRGVLFGLGLDSGPADVVAAAATGIAHRCADLVDGLGVEGDLLVDGGLARSATMLQRVADVTGHAVVPAGDLETSVRGGAMLAAVAPGVDAGPLPRPPRGAPVVPASDDDRRAEARARFAAALDAAKSFASG